MISALFLKKPIFERHTAADGGFSRAKLCPYRQFTETGARLYRGRCKTHSKFQPPRAATAETGTMRGGGAAKGERADGEKCGRHHEKGRGRAREHYAERRGKRRAAHGTAKAYTPQAAKGEREQCKQRRRAKQLRRGGKIMRYAPQTRFLCGFRVEGQEFSEIKL